ncbi:MAG TPA: hypothetical protein VNB29_07380 [Chthoniobacterales bacterium]|nr:hypothetical protein [Chthoniobacterales bacterium]
MKLFSLPLLVATACALLAGCATPQYKNKTDMLTAAGFRSFNATEPSQVALFKTLPADRLTPVLNHRRIYYVYPDPKADRIYAGTKSEYHAYEKLRARRKLPPDRTDTASMSKAPEWDNWRGLSDGWYTF